MDTSLRIWIKGMRESAGLTQVQAAEKFGVHRTTWVRWESGTHRPDTVYLMRLVQWSGSSLAELEDILQ